MSGYRSSGICLGIEFPDMEMYDTTQCCKEGLFISFTLGQDTDRNHSKGVPAHKIFIHKDLTVDDLSNFRSDTFI